jgi:hypothetical protein
MAGVRDTVSFVLDVMKDVPKIIGMLSIPVSGQPPSDRLKSLQLSGFLGIFACALVVAATMTRPTTLDVISFLLVALVFPVVASWLYSLVLKGGDVVAQNSTSLDDSLSLVIGSNLIGIAVFALARVVNMFLTDSLTVAQINMVALVVGSLVPFTVVFFRSMFATGSASLKRRFSVGLISAVLGGEVFLFLKAVIFFTS